MFDDGGGMILKTESSSVEISLSITLHTRIRDDVHIDRPDLLLSSKYETFALPQERADDLLHRPVWVTTLLV